ncbi:hypothetical protein [Pseudomonas brassicae]|uniref:hypothetical protein n=1 Tax=Pseudomonas brassicae TaxID=2708063 RepID=UPI0013D24494|nr:hypothetical protein [Pseudomonas brassicae]
MLITPMLIYAAGQASFWYLAALPVAVLLLGMLLRMPGLFVTGCTVASLAALLGYLIATSGHGGQAVFLWLGYIFSAPGMLVGIVVAAWLLKRRARTAGAWRVAGTGLLGAGAGFMLPQMIVCNTQLYCGVLSPLL